ncbi:MAG: amidohydrolase family protein [Acidobacteriaceae bacterium]
MKALCVDSHFHLWRYSAAEYGWIDEDMQSLRRDFLPADLKREMHDADVECAVAVQARQTLEETSWLLGLAREFPFIAGVVGWAPLADPDFPHRLESLVTDPRLKGLRHVLQDEPDDSYMLRDDFQRGMATLHATGLVYDILIFERQLRFAVQLADRNPNQVFVLDHLAKPKIRSGEISPWREQMREMARRPNVFCKLSGMVTEADWRHWTLDGLRPYAEIALECFGPERLMAGSDWPVCTLACNYGRWWRTLRELVSTLTPAEQQMVLGGNAARVYRLKMAEPLAGGGEAVRC